MSRNKKWKNAGDSRDAGGFVALPWAVLDSAAYQALGHPAKALLLEFARQYVRDNNGRLLASMAYLKDRGWRSNDVINRAKKELLEAGFIHETAKGQRPNKASWYAVTWAALDRIPGYDTGVAETFQRGAYRLNAPLTTTPRPISKAKTMTKTPSISDTNGYGLTPSRGALGASIAPPHGVERQPTAPSPGAIEGVFCHLSTPSHGDHLENHLYGTEDALSLEVFENEKMPKTAQAFCAAPAADQGRYLRLRPNPKGLFAGLGLAGLDAAGVMASTPVRRLPPLTADQHQPSRWH
jgi:hypothetical protein